MSKTILVTGATDGIGLETAKILVGQGHHVLLHGRSSGKLGKVASDLSSQGLVETFVADLSDIKAVKSLVEAVKEKHQSLDVLINNAGVLRTSNTKTVDGLDVRFAVNTIAPYLLTKELLPLLGGEGRVINLSSAAQSPVNLEALAGNAGDMDAMDAYSQSKLAITMWSRVMANDLGNHGPVIIAVNPGSLLGSKMVKEGFGMEGKDLSIGAKILVRLAVEDEFANSSGKYYDNDKGQFGNPYPDAMDDAECQKVINVIDSIFLPKK